MLWDKKPDKAVVVVSSNSEELEVDFLHPPDQACEVTQEPNPPADAPAGEQQEEPDHPVDILIEEPHPPVHIPAGDAEQPQEPGNPNLLLVQPPIPMTINQLNWSHFRPEYSGKPEEDLEAHLLRIKDCMTTHDFFLKTTR